MAKPIEEHLSDFALGMVRTEQWRPYVKQCLMLWETQYGMKTAGKVRSIINARIAEKRSTRV